MVIIYNVKQHFKRAVPTGTLSILFRAVYEGQAGPPWGHVKLRELLPWGLAREHECCTVISRSSRERWGYFHPQEAEFWEELSSLAVSVPSFSP